MTGDEIARDELCRVLLVEDDVPVRKRLAAIISGWEGGRLIGALDDGTALTLLLPCALPDAGV